MRQDHPLQKNHHHLLLEDNHNLSSHGTRSIQSTTTTTNQSHMIPEEEQGFIEEQMTNPVSSDVSETAFHSEGSQSLWQLILLTLCLAGVQFTWTVELAYGTPYLTSLGLSNSLTALVWLAGPLSGLLIQPLVGVYSDRCTLSLGRRRPFMIGGGVLVIVSILLIAYSKETAIMILNVFSSKSIHEKSAVNDMTIAVAAFSFYFLDFSINAVQASCRALIVDIAPLSQQGIANAWAGRMIGLGNVMGYFIGFLDLPKHLSFFGDTQMKVLCVLAIAWFIISIAVTCLSAHEIPYENGFESLLDEDLKNWYQPILDILSSMRDLPAPIQSVCNVQFLAWLGWFPFLFYSTSWVSEKATGIAEGNDQGTRAGSFALLLFALISVGTGFLLPMVCSKHPLDSSQPVSVNRRRGLDRSSIRLTWRQEMHQKILAFLELPSVWGWSLWLFAVLMLFTGIVHDGTGATVIIAMSGFCWGVTQWVPFTLMGECITYYSDMSPLNGTKSARGRRRRESGGTPADAGYSVVWTNDDEELEGITNGIDQVQEGDTAEHGMDGDDLGDRTTIVSRLSPVRLNRTSSSSHSHRQQQPVMKSTDTAATTTTTTSISISTNRIHSSNTQNHNHLEAGMVLGIHNIYIVLPQFLSTFVSSIVFALISFIQERYGDTSLVQKASYDSYGWALRVGAILSVFAGGLALKVQRVSSLHKHQVD